MNNELSDIRLIIEIKNEYPIELTDLTKSFSSLANEFTNYVSKTGDNILNREAKLYVKEIKSGSVICELVEMATIGVIPFVENINTVVGFGEYVSKAFNFFLGKHKDKPKEISQSNLKDLSQILNPIAKDSGSQINISTTVNGNVHLHINLSSIEANAVQNVIDRDIEKSKTPDTDDQIKL